MHRRFPLIRVAVLLCSVPLAACGSMPSWDASTDASAPVDTVNDIAPDIADTGVDALADVVDATDAQPDIAYDIQYVDATRDAATDVVIAPTHEYVYVMSAMNVDPDDVATNPHTGFDVDGLASTASDPMGCGHSDFGSALDPDQNSPAGCLFGTPGCNGGVDNQFPTMATTIQSVTMMDARALLSQSINNHQLVFVLRLTRVDSFVDDSDVGVQVYRGFPTFSTGCTSVIGGRVYQVDQASLTPGGTTLDDALFNINGRIVAGRLQIVAAATDVLTLRGSGLIPISLHALRLRGDVTPSGIARGNLGGWDTADDLVSQLSMLAPTYASLLPTVVSTFVDVQIAGVCIDRSMHPPALGGVSLGAGFAAVPASLSTTAPIATAQTPGTCGL